MAEVPTPSEAAGELGELARSQLADFAQAAEDYRFMIDLAVALFQDSPDAIIVADASGLIQLVNSQAELISRYPRAELRGKAVEMLVPGGPPSGAHRPSPA